MSPYLINSLVGHKIPLLLEYRVAVSILMPVTLNIFLSESLGFFVSILRFCNQDNVYHWQNLKTFILLSPQLKELWFFSLYHYVDKSLPSVFSASSFGIFTKGILDHRDLIFSYSKRICNFIPLSLLIYFNFNNYIFNLLESFLFSISFFAYTTFSNATKVETLLSKLFPHLIVRMALGT